VNAISDKTVQFHATKQLLLDTVLAMLQTENPGSITSEQVLAKARVSSGSLYHHFEDFADLLDQALCIEFEAFTNRTIDLLLMTNDQAHNLQEWAVGVQEARRITHGPQYERNRVLRVLAVAHGAVNARMRKRLGDVQDQLNQKFVRFVRDAQKSGYVKADLDPLTVAVFIQSYTFGSIIDDIAHEKVDTATWVDLLDRVARETFINLG
jgi:AcrR family transcriptional regulator